LCFYCSANLDSDGWERYGDLLVLKMQPVIRELAFKFHEGVTTRKVEAEDGKI
jgi:hypothetical protein